MYNQDSFFDLSPLGQIGLATLSLTLFALAFVATRGVLRGHPCFVRLSGAIIVFWAFVWLSPQVYYMYYRLLFSDLPLQWVIKQPIGPLDIVGLLTFHGRQNLAAHSQGVMGWILILAPFIRWRLRRS